jgi:hypothetical protein
VIGSLFLDCPDESVKRKRELLRSFPSPRREMALVISFLFLVIIAPVLTPWMVIGCYLSYRREVALMAWLKRNHRENVYEEIHPVKLPRIARQYFEQLAPEMLELSFREMGRYLLKPDPAPSYGFCFESADGRTVGVLGQMFDATYFSFSTLLANGLSLETSSVEETPELARVNESKTFRVVFSPGTSIADAYVRHVEEIAALEVEFGAHALVLGPDQFRDVLTYEGRVFSQLMFEMGKHDAPPPTPLLPSPFPAVLSKRGECGFPYASSPELAG